MHSKEEEDVGGPEEHTNNVASQELFKTVVELSQSCQASTDEPNDEGEGNSGNYYSLNMFVSLSDA